MWFIGVVVGSATAVSTTADAVANAVAGVVGSTTTTEMVSANFDSCPDANYQQPI